MTSMPASSDRCDRVAGRTRRVTGGVESTWPQYHRKADRWCHAADCRAAERVERQVMHIVDLDRQISALGNEPERPDIDRGSAISCAVSSRCPRADRQGRRVRSTASSCSLSPSSASQSSRYGGVIQQTPWSAKPSSTPLTCDVLTGQEWSRTFHTTCGQDGRIFVNELYWQRAGLSLGTGAYAAGSPRALAKMRGHRVEYARQL